jgi:hypothetical protein
LIDRKWHSSVLDFQLFRRADCDTDHYLVVVKVTMRLAGSKQTKQRDPIRRFTKLNEVQGKEEHPVEISNRFATLENLDAGVDIQ